MVINAHAVDFTAAGGFFRCSSGAHEKYTLKQQVSPDHVDTLFYYNLCLE